MLAPERALPDIDVLAIRDERLLVVPLTGEREAEVEQRRCIQRVVAPDGPLVDAERPSDVLFGFAEAPEVAEHARDRLDGLGELELIAAVGPLANGERLLVGGERL